jgi:hypothetical protein
LSRVRARQTSGGRFARFVKSASPLVERQRNPVRSLELEFFDAFAQRPIHGGHLFSGGLGRSGAELKPHNEPQLESGRGL